MENRNGGFDMSVLDEMIDLEWNCTKNCEKKRSMPVEHHIIRFRKDYIDFFFETRK